MLSIDELKERYINRMDGFDRNLPAIMEMDRQSPQFLQMRRDFYHLDSTIHRWLHSHQLIMSDYPYQRYNHLYEFFVARFSTKMTITNKHPAQTAITQAHE